MKTFTATAALAALISAASAATVTLKTTSCLQPIALLEFTIDTDKLVVKGMYPSRIHYHKKPSLTPPRTEIRLRPRTPPLLRRVSRVALLSSIQRRRRHRTRIRAVQLDVARAHRHQPRAGGQHPVQELRDAGEWHHSVDHHRHNGECEWGERGEHRDRHPYEWREHVGADAYRRAECGA